MFFRLIQLSVLLSLSEKRGRIWLALYKLCSYWFILLQEKTGKIPLYCNPGSFSKLINLINWRFWHFTNFHKWERTCFTVHFIPGKLISKLLIFINSKNLRTIRKLTAYENFQDCALTLRKTRGAKKCLRVNRGNVKAKRKRMMIHSEHYYRCPGVESAWAVCVTVCRWLDTARYSIPEDTGSG